MISQDSIFHLTPNLQQGKNLPVSARQGSFLEDPRMGFEQGWSMLVVFKCWIPTELSQ